MIRSITGILVELETPPKIGRSSANTVALIEPEGSATGYEVLLPAFLGPSLEDKIGQSVRLRTLHYLESQGQGSSFIPRLVGFCDDRERRFFELFTTVKGLGNRRALRALTIEPAAIAALIVDRNAKGLIALPEVGKRLAETIIAELNGKVDAFLDLGATDAMTSFKRAPAHHGPASNLPPVAADAVEALVTLGEPRAEAVRRIEIILGREASSPSGTEATVESLLQQALGG